jgi:predicted alpha/beta superfamily hydrolase
VFIGHCGPDPRAILFVTDANGLFGLAVDTVRLMQIPGLLPSLLVVGVGYPDAETVIDTVEIRARDLTPTPDDLFGTYALLKATTTFDRYIISSPSLWWDREVIFDVERQRADTERLQTEVFFGIGSLETDAGRRREAVNLADGHPAKPPACISTWSTISVVSSARSKRATIPASGSNARRSTTNSMQPSPASS